MAKKINEDYKKRFMNGFKMLCRSRHSYTVWSDCMALFGLSLANGSISMLKDREPFKSVYEEREKQYLNIINKYNKKEQNLFPQMLTLLVMELEERPNQDLLGELYMSFEISNKNNGQFFTPYNICELMSGLELDRKELGKTVHKKGYANIYDPTCGSGATLISVEEQCKEMFKKYNYRNHVYFVGQDIDITCVYMCLIQLSLHNVAGYVIHGNTLAKSEPELPEDLKNIYFTPMWFSDVWTMRRLFHNHDLLGRS